MHDYVVIDIETVKNDRADTFFASKKYEAPSNYKDPIKIEAAIAEKRAADANRAALYWWTGRVICICAIHGEERRTFCGDNEKAVLTGFFDWFPDGAQVIAKSGDYFDIPYLVGRALTHDLGIPNFLRPSRPIADVNHIFGFKTDQASKLEHYAFGLDLPGKLADGADVAVMHAEGRWSDIEEYCKHDTWLASEMLTRWLKPYKKGTV